MEKWRGLEETDYGEGVGLKAEEGRGLLIETAVK